ncbi:MAG: hypothetical protein CVT66_06160 [Actinobacteria bacterium HGW-Actinobacteria-6]|nr:MAG: hypothetical protein CVT66_06160 [Actinobacteria bacterium HGW-Actinobacteria-6]
MKSVVGLDPSLAATGICVSGFAPKTIVTKPGTKAITTRICRLNVIAAEVMNRVHPGSLVVIEAPGFSRGAQPGHHQLAGLWWLLVILLDARGVQFVEVSPSTLKKFATGRGNATKADMRMALFKRAGIDLPDDNQVDAWWLMQIGLHLVGSADVIDLPKDQLAVLSPLRGQLPAPG